MLLLRALHRHARRQHAAQQQLVGLACAKAAGEVGALAAPSLGLAATLVPDRTDGEWPHALPSLARVNSGVDALPVPETSIAPLGLSIAEPRVPIEARWPPDRSSSEVRVPVETPDAYGFVPSRSSLRSSALLSAVPAHDPPRWPMATVIAPAATVLEIMAHAPREQIGRAHV